MRNLARKLIEEYQYRPLAPSAFPHDSSLMGSQGHKREILALTGMMGSGKTTHLLDGTARVIGSGVPRERTLYVDLTDPRLLCTSRKESPLPALVDAFMERFPENRRSRTHLFLDGIGHVQGWQRFAKSLVDTYDMRITAADARSSWLGFPAQTKGIRVSELLPTSLSDYLQDVDGNSLTSIVATQQDYLRIGGLPAAQTGNEHIKALQDTARSALFDIALRYDQNVSVDILSFFFAYAMGETGRPLSLTKAQKKLEEAGIRTTRSTLKTCLRLLAEAHLLYTVDDLRFANVDNPRSPQTVIAGDHGMALAMSPRSSVDADSFAVTLAYLDLRRKEHLGEVFSYRAKSSEAPMLACANPLSGNVFSLIAFATRDDSAKATKTALRRIAEAQEHLHAHKVTLIVKEIPSRREETKHPGISVMTLREWLLQDNHM